jgi:hypothetical protein
MRIGKTYARVGWVWVLSCSLSFVIARSAFAQSQGAGAVAVLPPALRILAINQTAVNDNPMTIDVRLGDDLAVTFSSPPPQPLAIFLDNNEIKGINVRRALDQEHTFLFALNRTSENDAAWRRLLGPVLSNRAVTIAAGSPDGATVSAPDPIRLHFSSSWLARVLSIFLLFFFGIASWFGIKAGMLLDAGPRTSLSLGRLQMFVWTALVVCSFLLIWTVTGSADTVTPQCLALMGIAAATAMGAKLVGSAQDSALAENLTKTPPAAQARPEEQGIGAITPVGERVKKLRYSHSTFLADLLNDDNGPTLHRMQILVWTAILATLFIVDVWRDLSMPQFSDTLLALMGVSGGTYVGFKIPEANG